MRRIRGEEDRKVLRKIDGKILDYEIERHKIASQTQWLLVMVAVVIGTLHE